jgi:hypothetical protein
MLGKARKALFGIPSEKAVFERYGFVQEAWLRFQPVAHSLVEGYHATLEDSRFEVLLPRLNAVDAELRGFAYEGAGMGLAALDLLAPRKKRLQTFAEGLASSHKYTLYVGLGLALARLRRQPERFLADLDPLLGWVIVDGYGFHEGFFSWKRSVEKQRVPPYLSSYARRLFDQGLGRSIWFASGALVDRVVAIIGAFPLSRQADLWSGVGMASAYAGGATRNELELLQKYAAPYKAQLARGAAVAAKGRQDGGNPASHTELACQVFCDCSSTIASHILDVTSKNIPTNSEKPAYEIWRQRVQAELIPSIERKR